MNIYNKYKNNNLDMEQYYTKESQKRYGINNYQELENERQTRYGEYPIGKVQYIYGQSQNFNNDDPEQELKEILKEIQEERA